MNVDLPAAVMLRREGGEAIVEGTVTPYYDGTPATEYEIAPGVSERIVRGAYDDCLARRCEVVATWAHQKGQVLGRTGSGTLMLRNDDAGLHFTLRLPDTSLGRDVAVLVGRGDVGGASMGGYGRRRRMLRDDARGRDVIEVSAVDLDEVSLVASPAYAGTGVTIRRDAAGAAAVLREVEAWRATRDRLARRADLLAGWSPAP